MKMSRFRLFFLILAIVLVASVALAQHQPAPPAQRQSQAGHQAPAHGAQGQHAAQSSQGEFGRELAHASREAAGEEEEETKAFKESPSVQLLARLTGLDVHKAYWVGVLLNFAVIAVLLGAVLKSKLPAAFRARTESIQKGMEDARKASEDANRRLAGIETRLSRLDVEIAEMRAAAEAEAVKEEERIRAAAEEDKLKIVKGAEAEIAAAAKVARRDLRAYAAELAVSLAERRIHVDAATDQALVRSFVDQLGKDGR